MKTNHKLQLLAVATVAMLVINPAARAQTPALLSDADLLHALATGQVGFTNDDFTLVNGGAPASSQLGAGGGHDDGVIAGAIYGGAAHLQGNPTTNNLGDACDVKPTTMSTYGGGLYLQGQPTVSYGGALYYGGGIYNNAAAAPPVNSWYNDVYGNTGSVAAGDLNNDGYRDADGDTYGVAAGDLNNDGFADNDCDGIRNGTSQPANGIVAEEYPEWLSGVVQNDRPTTASYGAGVYKNTAVASPVNMWYNDVYNNTAGNVTTGFLDLDGSSADLRPTTASYGGAIYRSTASSLIGEDLPGEQLTDAQLDALILNVLAGVCDTADNCLTAPMPR